MTKGEDKINMLMLKDDMVDWCFIYWKKFQLTFRTEQESIQNEENLKVI